MGIVMSKSQAKELGAALRAIDEPGTALVRLARVPRVGLVATLILPPYGTETEGRHHEIARIGEPDAPLPVGDVVLEPWAGDD